MITLIDNYDSFTYNLVQYLGDLDQEVQVFRNDKIKAAEIIAQNPAGILISPGPSDPDHAGICLELVQMTAERGLPLLGICLGHQALAQAFGGKVIRAPVPMHGKISAIHHTETSVFQGIPSPFDATRYHSLIVEKASLPSCFDITAHTEDGLIMGLQHKDKPLYGVQFHPESIATDHGHKILQNFLERL